METFLQFSHLNIALSLLLFTWTGFVRSGLGFGGGALGLPLMLLVFNDPVFWMPIMGFHLLFFSSLTLRKRLRDIDYVNLKRGLAWIIPFSLIGVMGLINLPTNVLVILIYGITIFYSVLWLFDIALHSSNKWVDRFLLSLGGYVAGTSLTGAPILVAVFMRNVSQHQLRNTLFLLWFILVSIKMIALVAVEVPLNIWVAILFLPGAFLGHIIGLKAHAFMVSNDKLFKRIVGGALVLVSILGLASVTI